MRRPRASTGSLLALFALLALSVGVCSCGGSSDKAVGVTAPVIAEFGRPADALDRSEIAALVSGYYAAAGAEQGAKACGMLFFAVAESLAEKYGRAPGPLYLNGAKTCQAVLTRVFEHFHAQLSMRPTVTLVHVSGNRARALLAWKALPAGYVEARREGTAWKLENVLATAVP